MGTNLDIVGFALPNRFHHDERVSRVEATCYVGNVDEGVELSVWTAFEVAIAFAQVHVDEGFVLNGSHLELQEGLC